MTDRIVIYNKQTLAMAQAFAFLLLTPISTGVLLLSGLAFLRGDWVSGLILLLIGVPATVFCFAQISFSMRAAKPHAEMLSLTQKTFYDCRIMKHPVPWSKLEWETCPRSGRIFINVDRDYGGHMHRGVPDLVMSLARRLTGRFSYPVSSAQTGMPKSTLAHEMRAYRRPTGNHFMRDAVPAE